MLNVIEFKAVKRGFTNTHRLLVVLPMEMEYNYSSISRLNLFITSYVRTNNKIIGITVTLLNIPIGLYLFL